MFFQTLQQNQRIKVKLNGMSPVQYRTHIQLIA
ncbi:IS3 family transposase [Bacillus toyonensis]